MVNFGLEHMKMENLIVISKDMTQNKISFLNKNLGMEFNMDLQQNIIPMELLYLDSLQTENKKELVQSEKEEMVILKDKSGEMTKKLND